MLDNIKIKIKKKKNTTKLYKPQAPWEKRGVIKRGLAAAKCCHSDTSGHRSPAG